MSTQPQLYGALGYDQAAWVDSCNNIPVPENETTPDLSSECGGGPAQVAPAYGKSEEDEILRDAIFEKHLDIVTGFEHCISIRIFIWIPMLLQAIKLSIVSGAIVTRATALYQTEQDDKTKISAARYWRKEG
ncbi:MAG: hypothetical protein M1813_005244 [Trichoglossum hirsutum]|nr:MAG: hypothetical protein M1813_005244 [Trichoglossum hirsutum]